MPIPSLYSIDDLLKTGQGDAKFVISILHTFVESCEEAIGNLHQGLREADLTRLKTTAHTLKPSLQYLNIWQALPPVEKLDTWADAFEPEPLQALVADIERRLHAVRAQIALDLQQEQVMTRVIA